MSKPFDLGINKFKKLLKENPNFSKSDRAKAVKAYKQRANERLREVLDYYNKGKEDGTRKEQKLQSE
jgi:hypothetical protein